MSAIIERHLRCDIQAEGCEINYGVFEVGYGTIKELRKQARDDNGWKFSKGKDICPNCIQSLRDYR